MNLKYIKRLISNNAALINYVFFGVLTTIVNLLTFWLFNSVFNQNYLLANLIAWFVSVLFAFFTNKYFVFKSHTKGHYAFIKEFLLFIWMRVLSGIFDMGSMYILVSMLKVNGNLAKILTQFIIVVLNYVFSKTVIFKKRSLK